MAENDFQGHFLQGPCRPSWNTAGWSRSGARPSNILQEFERTFNNKPHDLYQLPHSFRFGPVIAQYAQSVIERNVSRIEKPLIAHAADRGADIHVFKATPPPTPATKHHRRRIKIKAPLLEVRPWWR